MWIFHSQHNYTKFCYCWEYFISQQLKRGSIHSANHTKQLPNVPLSETLGHAKILLTLHWDVIRLMLQWFRVIRWNYTRTCSGSLLSDNQMHLSKTLVVWEQNFCTKKIFSPSLMKFTTHCCADCRLFTAGVYNCMTNMGWMISMDNDNLHRPF